MGCLHSKDASVLQQHGKGPQISSARKAEAKDHFGLTSHEPLGKGGTGETFLCVRKSNREREAVKVIRRPIPKSVRELLANEIVFQAELGEGHFNLVTAHEVLLTDTHLCLLMEFAAGGTLTDYVTQRARSSQRPDGLLLSEDEARYFWQQCISAVDYMHAHKVAHRDLKLDNILLDTHSPPYVKVCDFGFSHALGGDNLHTLLGTPVYTSPQIIEHKACGYNGRAADVWAVGVLLFAMLLGAFPFDNDLVMQGDEQSAFTEVLVEQVREHWSSNPHNREGASHLSAECRDLLDRIFELKEEERITIAGIRAHPWFNKPLPPPYAAAAAALAERQQQIEALVRMAPDAEKAERKRAINALLVAACEPTGNGGVGALNVDIMLKHAQRATRDGQGLAVIEDVTYAR